MSERNAPRSRFGRYIVSRGWLHLVLLTCMAVFLFPFAWMLATSFKTDEELTEPGWLPQIPRFVPRSPYVLSPPELEKPLPVNPRDWQRLLPALERETRQAVSRHLQNQNPYDLESTAQIESVAPAIINRLSARLRLELWTGPEEPLLQAYRAELTREAIASALNQRIARLELRGLQLRTFDGHITQLCDEKGATDFWKVASGPATLRRDRGGATYLQYDFGASNEPITLECRISSPIPREEWHKITFSYKPDNSWHRIDARLLSQGYEWKSTITNYTAQSRPTSIIFQFSSYEDQTLKPRKWTPLEKGPQPVVAALNHQTILTITITPSSTMQAIWGKARFNYDRAFRSIPFWTYVGNSLILVVLTTVGTLFSSTFVAYAFARLRWPGRGVALVILLSTIMLPAQVTMIPSFLVWRNLGLYNTLGPMWLPSFFGGAFFIFLMIQHMKTIPRELEEAARIDGLGALGTWWYVMVPLVKPTAAAIAIMTVMGAWNEFMGPLIYLRDQARFPLSLGVFAAKIDGGNDWTLIMAGNVLMTLPMIVMFLLFQRYFIQGMTMGGVKG